jgi:hypothetical protein
MDFAYGIGRTTLFGKVVRMDNSKIRTQVNTIAIKRVRLPCWRLHISDEMVTLTRLGRIDFEYCASSAALGSLGKGILLLIPEWRGNV